MLRALVVTSLLALATPGLAVDSDEVLPDPALETRARAISAELRCLVCQNQSIDDSDAPLARDLRVLVRDRLKAGESDGAIRAFVVARYGEFVLLRPPFGPHTALLWLGPALILGGAAAWLWLARRRGGENRPPDTLTGDEEERLRAALDERR